MFCSNCGSQINDNSMFCGKCGAKIGGTPAQPPVQPAYQQPYQQPAAPPPWQQYPQYPNRRNGISKSWFIAGGIGVLVLVLCMVVFRSGGGPIDYSALSPGDQRDLREDLFQRLDQFVIPALENASDGDIIGSAILGGITALFGGDGLTAGVKSALSKYSTEMEAVRQEWISDNNLDPNTVNVSIDACLPEYVSHLKPMLE